MAYTLGLGVFTTPETIVTSVEIAITSRRINRANVKTAIGMIKLRVELEGGVWEFEHPSS